MMQTLIRMANEQITLDQMNVDFDADAPRAECFEQRYPPLLVIMRMNRYWVGIVDERLPGVFPYSRVGSCNTLSETDVKSVVGYPSYASPDSLYIVDLADTTVDRNCQ